MSPDGWPGEAGTMIVFLDGAWLPAEAARIPIHDRGFLHGDGVFETALLRQGRFFRLEQHLSRLDGSARLLGLTVPHREGLAALCRELAARNGAAEGSLRITVTRGSGAGERILVTLSPPDPAWQRKAHSGWTLVTATIRRPPAESVPPELKGLGRMYALLARREAAAAGADDALLLDVSGAVAEGPTWNVFWRCGAAIRTPALGAGLLAGVTRGIVLELAREAGYRVEEGVWGREELHRVDEVFATMTSVGIVPVLALDGRKLPSQSAAHRLRPRYEARMSAELTGAEG